jgi:hypothetical protein
MIKDLVLSIFKPVAGIFEKREERKKQRESAHAKLAQAKVDQTHAIELNKDEWEHLAVNGLSGTWKDEYVTVSIVSILNLIVLGGILGAFGHPQVLEGLATALTALGELGVDFGFLLEATVLAAIGLNVWKRF